MRHPNPTRSLYLGIREGDLAGKPYAAFYRPRMDPLPEHAKDALANGPIAEPLLPRLADAPRLLDPGDQELENGFGIQEDGSLHVATRTAMPDVSPAMVDWWFGWHSDEPQRYKLWHPRAHVHAEWGSAPPAGSRGRARYIGRTSFVDEYLGSRMSHVAIGFLPPFELGFNEAALADPEQATIVCAKIGFADYPVDAGYLVHHVRRVPGGSEMRSRFWLGGPYGSVRTGLFLDPIATWAARRAPLVDEARGRDLLVHCSQEMSHLASFLPAVYSELGDT